MRQLKSIVPIIIVLVVVLASSVGFGFVSGSNPQNEQALLAALNILAGETAAASPSTPRETALLDDREESTSDSLASRNLPASDSEIDTPSERTGYFFLYNGVRVQLGRPILDIAKELGQERDFYSYASCAFDGEEKVYVYEGFEITSYMRDANDIDRLYSIIFLDDRVATVEGVRIGQGYEEMIAAYGTECEEFPGSYIYIQEGTAISFSLQDGIIVSITYFVEDIREYGV
jgi:hypothetical protein